MQTSRSRPRKSTGFTFDDFIDTEQAKQQAKRVVDLDRVWGEMDDTAKLGMFKVCARETCTAAVDKDPALRARIEAIKAARKQGGEVWQK